MSETLPNDRPLVTDLFSRRASGIPRKALPSPRVLATAALAASAIVSTATRSCSYYLRT